MGASTALVKIALQPLAFQSIAIFANNVIFAMSSPPGSINFPAPHPTLGSLTAAFNALVGAITTWGPVGNRGSHADYLDLKLKADICRDLLYQLASYVQNMTDPSTTYAAQAVFISTSGFNVKNLPVPQGLLGMPEDFHQEFNNSIDPHQPFLQWKKPLALTSPNNVKSYEVFRSPFNVQPTVSIATVTASRFVDSDPSIINSIQYYWVCAVNDVGRGAFTASLLVSIPA
jgi:hypothetical protein